jgi:hypothetical protein
MRVYLPATVPLLARLREAGELALPEGSAVTETLRAWYAEGDEEQLEYAALTSAARASLRLLANDPDAARRRVVVAADVPDGRVATSPGDEHEPGVIKITGAVRLVDVAALHVDEAGAQESVMAAVRSLSAADKGDPDAQFAVDAVEDYDLLWYAAQELGDLVQS